MDIIGWFDINNTLVNIPLGKGYALSWIEAVGTIFGLLCIYLASKEKSINYLFGLINVTLFGIIFFQIHLYGLLLLQLFFFCANLYGWYAWTQPVAHGSKLQVRWLSRSKLLLTLVIALLSVSLLAQFIDPVFFALARCAVAMFNLLGFAVELPELQPDQFPLADAAVTALSVIAQILMTRKYVENWLLWVVVNLLSVGLYAAQGVYALALEYVILLFIAGNGAREWIYTARRNHSQPLRSGANS